MPIEPVIETIQDDLFGGSAAYVPARTARKPEAPRAPRPVQGELFGDIMGGFAPSLDGPDL